MAMAGGRLEKRSSSILLGVIFGLLFFICKGTAVAFTIIILAGFLLWKYLPEEDRPFLIKLFVFGLLLRIVLFFMLYVYSVSQGGYGEIIPDSRFYFLRALLLILLLYLCFLIS